MEIFNDNFLDNTDIGFIISGSNIMTVGSSSVNISGSLIVNQITASSISGTFIGDGSGLTNLSVTGSNSRNEFTAFQIQNSLTSTTTWAPYAFGGLFASNTQIANRLYMAPFILKEDVQVSKLGCEVTSYGVSASLYVGVYELNTNYYPSGSPVISSTALSGTTNGYKTYTLGSPYTLVKNKWYGMAFVSNVNVATRTLPSINFLGSQVTSAINNNTMTRDLTPGFTSLPSGSSMTGLSNIALGVFLQRT